MIQTRWHLDDLAGRILAEADRTGEKWTVINLPAEALPNDALGRQPGDMLWGDDGYGYARDLKKAKLVHTARDWSSQFQQNPVPDQGAFFQKEWLRGYEHMPPINNLHIYGASDFATKDGEGDYTVHLTIGVDQNSHMYVLDMWRKQADSQAWVESWCALTAIAKLSGLWIEKSETTTKTADPAMLTDAELAGIIQATEPGKTQH